MIYTTMENEILDEIVYRFYGSRLGIFEKILEHNRFLARYDAHLPGGVKIDLFDIDESSEEKTEVSLWE